MIRVAIPRFRSRVSPVFDFCTCVLLLDLEGRHEIERREIFLDHFSLLQRADLLEKSEVALVICGAISDILYNLLQSKNIALITGIVGEVEQVITAYTAGRLDRPQFYMPGYKCKNRQRGCRLKQTGKQEETISPGQRHVGRRGESL